MSSSSLQIWERGKLVTRQNVLRLFDDGLDTEQIALQLEIGESEVKRHISAANRILQRDIEQDVARLQAHKLAVLSHHLSELEYAFAQCIKMEDWIPAAQLSRQVITNIELQSKIDGSMATQKIDVEVRILSLAVQMGISEEDAQLAMNEVKLLMAEQKQRR